MIKFADKSTEQQVWDMWKTVFGDSDDYMEVYFRHKYSNENTLIYIKDGKAVSSLQMLHYNFTFCGSEIPIIYLSGVCTLSSYRGRGYSSKLLMKSFEVAAERSIPLLLLVPQEEWLLRFYEKLGFAQTFDAGKDDLPSLSMLIKDSSDDLSIAYNKFDAIYRAKDMTVQKSFDDFKAIVDEAKLFDFPSKKNLPGMARIINAVPLLTIFADKYPETNFSAVVKDDFIEKNNATYIVSNGVLSKKSNLYKSNLNVDIRDLAQLMLGYHTSEKTEPLNYIFPEKTPEMHYMLE